MAAQYAGLGLLCGGAAALALAGWLARRNGIAWQHTAWIGALALASALVLLPVLRAQAAWLAWALPAGNLYVTAGFAVIPPLLYCLARRLNLALLADVWAPAVLLLLAGARVDCFLRGCCWGDVCCDPALLAPVLDAGAHWQVYTVPAVCGAGWPLAVTFPYGSPAHMQHVVLGMFTAPSTSSLPCHPVQLYEAAGTVIVALGLLMAWPRRRFPLQIWCGAVGWYSTLRFVMEFMRADHPAVWCGLTMVQVISLCMLAIALACSCVARRTAAVKYSHT